MRGLTWVSKACWIPDNRRMARDPVVAVNWTSEVLAPRADLSANSTGIQVSHCWLRFVAQADETGGILQIVGLTGEPFRS
jgi:hypothetical protein